MYIVSSIVFISCPSLRRCSENLNLPSAYLKSFLCSLNLVLKFLWLFLYKICCSWCMSVYKPPFCPICCTFLFYSRVYCSVCYLFCRLFLYFCLFFWVFLLVLLIHCLCMWVLSICWVCLFLFSIALSFYFI